MPLLTVRGQTFASRVAATLVENAGVSVELVVHTKQDCTSMFYCSTMIMIAFIFFDHDYFIYFLDNDVQLSRPPCTCPGTHASCNGCAEPSAEVSE